MSKKKRTETSNPETPNPETPNPETVSVDDLAAQAATEFPDPSGATLPPVEGGGSSEPAGETFDPDIHVLGPDGKPRRNRDGSLTRRGGRKKGCAPNSPRNTRGSSIGGFSPSANGENLPVGPSPESVMVATMAANVIAGVRVWIGGPDAAPAAVEVESFTAALAAWAEYEKVSVSPRWVGVGALVAFVAPAFVTAKGQERIAGLFGGRRKVPVDQVTPPANGENSEG